MLPLADLVKLIFTVLGQAFFGWLKEPNLLYYPFMLAIVLSIVFRQFRRQAELEVRLFGVPFSQPWRQLLISAGFGLAGGLVASFLMVFAGLPLSEELGLIYVWPVVLFLMLISPRFMCFAYGGGVVGAVSLVLRGLNLVFPGLGSFSLLRSLMAVDLPALMALIGVLHFTESFLIFISGHINASPVILESPRGQAVGGFMLQRFWPLPITALLAEVIRASEPIAQGVEMPEWWPILQPLLQPGPGLILIFSLFPIVAALGYSDIAVASTPREKSKISARNLALYSLVLLALSLLSGRFPSLHVLPVLFAPLGHEYLIQAGNRREWAGVPLYIPPERGVRLLTVLPDSAARGQGLGPGWVVLNVNGFEVNSRRDLASALDSFPGLAEIQALSPKGDIKTVRLHQTQGRLGLIPVPDSSEPGNYLKIGGKGFLGRLWEKHKKKQSGV